MGDQLATVGLLLLGSIQGLCGASSVYQPPVYSILHDNTSGPDCAGLRPGNADINLPHLVGHYYVLLGSTPLPPLTKKHAAGNLRFRFGFGPKGWPNQPQHIRHDTHKPSYNHSAIFCLAAPRHFLILVFPKVSPPPGTSSSWGSPWSRHPLPHGHSTTLGHSWAQPPRISKHMKKQQTDAQPNQGLRIRDSDTSGHFLT